MQMDEIRTALRDSRPQGIGRPCAICDWIDLERHAGEQAAVEEDWAAPLERPVRLCSDHRYEVNRLLEKERPGVTPSNAHLVYCQLYKARRGGRLKRFGEVVSSLPR
jgi:hypothetical protein